MQSDHCGWQQNDRKERIFEPDRAEKIACSIVDVIGKGSDAFPARRSGHWGGSVTAVLFTLSSHKLLVQLLLAFALVFSSALTLPEVNITVASREWVVVHVQLKGVCTLCFCALCVNMCSFPPILSKHTPGRSVFAGHLLMPAQEHK